MIMNKMNVYLFFVPVGYKTKDRLICPIKDKYGCNVNNKECY